MTRMKFRDLIDMAIGSPELGHVDFQALHFLLMCFAERLEIVEHQIEYDKTSSTSSIPKFNWKQRVDISTDLFSTSEKVERQISPRLAAGADEEGAPAADAPAAEAAAEEAEGEAPAPPPTQEATEEKPAEPEAPPPAPPSPPPIDVGNDDGGDVDIPAADVAMDQGFDFQTDIDNNLAVVSQGEGFEPFTPENLKLGICMMKDQLELAMQQITLLTEFMLEKNPDTKKIAILNRYLRKLRHIMRQNIYFESCFHADDSISWHSSIICDEEGLEEEHYFKPKPIPPPEPAPVEVEPPPVPEICKDELGLEPCLVYTADQLLDMFLEMRSEFCQLLNKVNTIAATILEQDYHGLMGMAANLQKDQQRMTMELKNTSFKIGKLELKLSSILRNIEQIVQDVEELQEKKADTDQVLCWLSHKASYEDLEKKVDKTELMEFQEELSKKFCEYRDMINTNERNIMKIIDNLRETLGVNFLEKLLYALRDKFQHDIDMLNAKLDHYIAMTDDECAAATARVKVVKDLQCLSCDTACVMHKIQRGKVGKMGSAQPGKMIGPLITYELSRIRKSGVMGFYRKDEVPQTTKDYLKEQDDLVNLEKCKPRHAGGIHTATTRKDFADRVMQKSTKRGCEDF